MAAHQVVIHWLSLLLLFGVLLLLFLDAHLVIIDWGSLRLLFGLLPLHLVLKVQVVEDLLLGLRLALILVALESSEPSFCASQLTLHQVEGVALYFEIFP